MNPEQWSALIRVVLGIVLGPGSYLILKGVLTPDQANQLIPILVPVIMAGGGAAIAYFANKSHSAKAVVDAVNSDSVPGVKAVASTSSAPQVSVTKSGTVVPASNATGG